MNIYGSIQILNGLMYMELGDRKLFQGANFKNQKVKR